MFVSAWPVVGYKAGIVNLVYRTEGVLLAVTKKGREEFLGSYLRTDQEVHLGETLEFIAMKYRFDGKADGYSINSDYGGCWLVRYWPQNT